MDLHLFYNGPATLDIATAGGVDALVVDCEQRGKHVRQQAYDTEINCWHPRDCAVVRSAAPSLTVICRLDSRRQRGDHVLAQAREAVAAGAHEIILPMVESLDEVQRVLDEVADRAAVGIMLETAAAFALIEQFERLPLRRTFVGLNDLMIERGSHQLFAPLLDGTIDRARARVRRMQFGLGGLTLPDRGHPVPCRLLLGELTRLGCDFTFLRRSFYRDLAASGLEPAAALARMRAACRVAQERPAETVAAEREEFRRLISSLTATASDTPSPSGPPLAAPRVRAVPSEPVRLEASTGPPRESIQLFTVTDDAYAAPLAVLARSIQESRAGGAAPTLHVFTLGFRAENRRRVERSAPGIDMTWNDLRPSFPPEGLPAATGLRPATWGRLFAADALAERLPKALYLDADMLITADLGPLWATPLSGRVLAAVTSPGNPRFGCPLAGLGTLWRALGTAPTTPYFQAGLLLIDLHAWTSRALTQRVSEACRLHGRHFTAADQDALNAVLSGDYVPLPLRWNQTHLLRDRLPWAYAFFPTDEVDDARTAPAVIHFTGSDKPWLSHPGSSPACGRWWDVLSRTDFVGLRPPWGRILRQAVRRRLTAWLAGDPYAPQAGATE